jgi:hypothetical protein
MTQYFSAILAFVAVVAGITGDAWDKQLLKPTRFGWAIIATAALSMVVSIVAAYRDHKKLDWQKSQRTKVRTVAEMELREALNHFLHPFGMLWMNIIYGLPLRDPSHKLNQLEYDEARFYGDSEYLVSKLRERAFRELWPHFDLRRDPEYPSLAPSSTWSQFFSDSAARADRLFESIITKYGSFLEAETLLQIHALQSDEFFRMRLIKLPMLVDMNQHLAAFSVANAFLVRDETSYLRFVETVGVLANRLSPGAGP